MTNIQAKYLEMKQRTLTHYNIVIHLYLQSFHKKNISVLHVDIPNYYF